MRTTGSPSSDALEAGAGDEHELEALGLSQRLGVRERRDPAADPARGAGELLAAQGAAVEDGDRRLRERERQRDPEHRAGARLALGPDPPGVLLDDRAGDRRAEARAALLAVVGRVHLAEPLEDRLELVERDPRPSSRTEISAWPPWALTIVRTLPPRGELDRVADQVHERLHDPVGVDGQLQVGGRFPRQLDPGVVGDALDDLRRAHPAGPAA